MNMAAKQTDEFERTPRRRKFKRSNPELRDRAMRVVRLWYQDRVDSQTNEHASVNGKPVLPAVHVKRAPAERSTSERRTVVRPMLDANEEPVIDDHGNPVLEHVPIMDALTAHGSPSTTYVMSWEEMHRGDATGYSRRTPPPSQVVKRARDIMIVVQSDGPEYVMALEMKAAGYDDMYVAQELGCGINIARSLVAEGLAVVGGLLSFPSRLNSRKPLHDSN